MLCFVLCSLLVLGLWPLVFLQSTKYKDQSSIYSNEIRSAAAVAQGEKSNDTIENAPSK